MTRTTVEDILHQIEQLSLDDRLRLQSRMAELAEDDWRHAAEIARRTAREKGIDRAVIDQACEHVRDRP